MSKQESGSTLVSEVSEVIRIQNEHTRVDEIQLFPKTAEIVDKNPNFSSILPEGNQITLKGRGYLPSPDMMGRRTVFLEDIVEVNGQNYFLEVKGYGFNGRELFPSMHDEGDLFYGMFMDFAQREFYIPLELEKAGLNDIQTPVALMRFSEADFVKYSMVGLSELIDARLFFSPPFSKPDRVRDAVVKLVPEITQMSRLELFEKEMRKSLGEKVSSIIFDTYQKGGKSAVRNLTTEVGLVEEVAGLLDERQAGYVIRAVKSPIRVGDLHDPNIVTERNKAIARKIGYTTRRMLELGYFNTSPNPGNWTSEGELVDFEDVYSYPAQKPQIEKVMDYNNKHDMRSFLDSVLGKETTGYLASDFQEGFIGHKTSANEVVEEAIRILASL